MNIIMILALGIVSMFLGAIWFGPLFGKTWMEIIGADKNDEEAREKMKKESGKLYLVQFVLTLIQIFVFSIYVSISNVYLGWQHGLLIWLAFIMPTIAGSAMWNNNPAKVKCAQFLIQSGYQLVLFLIFGLAYTLL